MNWQVYTNPNTPTSQTLTGMKGSSFLETGYVYAPYVPPELVMNQIQRKLRKAGLKLKGVTFTPEDFKPRAGILTRYGKKAIRKDFYGTIRI